MAYREDQVTGRMDPNEYGTVDRGPGSREIRSDIERTRREMDRNLDALEQKLTPTQLALEAWGLFRGGSTAGASRLWRIAREHPGPAAVVGVGLAWLMTEASKGEGRGRRDSPRYAGAYGYGYGGNRGYSNDPATGFGYPPPDWDSEQHEGRVSSALHTAKDKVSDVAGTAKEAVVGAKDRMVDATETARERATELSHQARERARYQARRAQVGFWQTMEERPLALGAAALALGVVAGLLVPSTRKEDELMGETRDRLMDRAREVGGEALEKGKQVASVAVDTLKEEAQRQDLTPEALAEKVRNIAKEATNTVKEEGKKQVSELKETVTAG
jgi:hypothetical protein